MTVKLINTTYNKETYIRTDEIEIEGRGVRFFVSEPTAAHSIAMMNSPDDIGASIDLMIPALVRRSDGSELTESQARSLPAMVVKDLVSYITAFGTDSGEKKTIE